MTINELKFDKDGLIPAVVVDAITKKVLTVAQMNRESLEISMQKGLTCFYSRSRDELWLKGETSGNYQHIVSITADCDNDALVVVVEKDGPACHTGEDTCFFNSVFENDEIAPAFSVQSLIDTIEGRKLNPKEGSYTTYLFEKGIDKILKKVGEEATELVMACKDEAHERIIAETADLWFHSMVALSYYGLRPEQVAQELARREGVSGLEEKASRPQ